MLMCAVIVTGMAPGIFSAAPVQDVSKVYAGDDVIEIDPGSWFPEELKVGDSIDVPENPEINVKGENPAGIEGYFCGFYEDAIQDTLVYWDTFVDGEGEAYSRYTGFEENRSYFAFFRIYTMDEYGYPEEYDGKVSIGGELLRKNSGNYYFLKMTIGDPETAQLMIDLGGKGELPESFPSGGVIFEKGDSIYALLNEWADSIESMRTPDDEVITGWKYKYGEGDSEYYLFDSLYSFESEFYNICNGESLYDVTLSAVWKTEAAAEEASFYYRDPEPGTFWTVYGWDRDSDQLCASLYGIYTDPELENIVNMYTEAEKGIQYYAKLLLTAEKGYYIDKDDLPKVYLNGEAVTIEHDESGYYFIWAFKATSYYSLTLKLNYPDHRYSDDHKVYNIPEGENLYQVLINGSDRSISLWDALFLMDTAGDGIDYTYFKTLQKSSLEDTGFSLSHPSISLDDVNGYSLNGDPGLKEGYTNLAEWEADSSIIAGDIHSDLTLYLQWDRELESVRIENIAAPVCGQTQEIYYDRLGDGNSGVTFEKGITAECTGFVSENKTESLSSDTVFKGGTGYTVSFNSLKKAADDDTYFNAYLTDNTKIEYEGRLYENKGEGNYYITVTAVHDMPADAATVKENEVATTCETAGSYDEVLRYKCAHCGEAIETITHITIPAIGHKWGEWTVVKEATEEEEGIEERVCKNDPEHKETRAIPKKQKQEEPKQPEEPEVKKPDTEIPKVVSDNKSEKINGEDVTISWDVTYPKAVTWTGSRISKKQLQAISEQIAKIKISGLDKAISGFNTEADLTKLFTISYVIGKEKNVNKQGSFYVKLKLNSKVLKKAKIKGADKKALQKIVNELNKEFKEKPCKFDIVPVELKDAESVIIKAKLKNGEVQLNDDGSIKGLKSLKIKVAVPGLKKGKTYRFSAKKAAKVFTIKVTDQQNKKALVSALAGQNFSGSRSGVEIKK